MGPCMTGALFNPCTMRRRVRSLWHRGEAGVLCLSCRQQAPTQILVKHDRPGEKSFFSMNHADAVHKALERPLLVDDHTYKYVPCCQ